MGTKIIKTGLQKFAFTVFALLFSLSAMAQETGTSTEVTTKTTTTEEWYLNPTYLIVGAVVLIILIALLMRGRGSRD